MVISKHRAKSQFLQWAAIDPSRGSIADYIKRCRQEVFVPPNNKNCGQGKTAVIIGAGVAGLTSAYELLNNEDINLSRCVILEANNRIGGRSFTVRPGDVIKEEEYAFQKCKFVVEDKDNPPYLNAGPGRIPSSHKRLLGYLKKFKVPMEVYVMASDSNRTYVEGHFENKSVPNRQLAYNMQGWVAQYLYQSLNTGSFPDLCSEEIEKFQEFLIKFGDLDENGGYQGSDRAGYDVLPGVNPGQPVEPLSLQELVRSQFWKTHFYQPIDFLWQPTLFQPVGGMDKIVYAFKEQLEPDERSEIKLNAVVKQIEYISSNQKYCISYQQEGEDQQIQADYCLSNIPIPLLKEILPDNHFTPSFQAALEAVYKAQEEGVEEPGGYCRKFLADTTKVGWQAERRLWQEVEGEGDVPIYGGISWSSDEIDQIWYPSDQYHANLGVLTGAYNFSAVAKKWGCASPQERLCWAKEQAKNLGGDNFADGLKHGLAIAWQNIPYQKGGWAQWITVENGVTHFNVLVKGDKNFYIVGDQLSNLSGWQEGAVSSALNAVCQLADLSYRVPDIDMLPDTRLTVEGAFWATLPAYVR